MRSDQNVTTLMLRAFREDYGTSTWRRFGLNPYLQVVYDSYPNAPTNLTEQNGALPCVTGANRPWVFTKTPQLAGQVSDPDGGTLYAKFAVGFGTAGNNAYVNDNGANLVTVGTPGPNQSATAQLAAVPSGWINADGTYNWSMQTTDGQLWSPWVGNCEFTVDTAVPLAPTIAMTGTAPVNQGDTASFSVSVGMATAGLADIDHFIYTTDGSEPQPQGSPSITATQGTDSSGKPIATANLTTTAINANQNYIKVKAVNKAGTPGPDGTCTASAALDGPSCSYHVQPVVPSTALVGAWAFDEMGGRTPADTANTTPGNSGLTPHPGTLNGGGSWIAGYNHGDSWTHPDTGDYSSRTRGALNFDGSTAYVSTSGPVLDTTKSFSVAAWAKLTDTSNYHSVVTQDSSGASIPILHYSKDFNAWAMSMATSDVPQAPAVRATSFNPPDLNVWTHLVGTFDASTGTLTLYVNGVKQHTAVASGLASLGSLVIGAGKWNNTRVDYFAGGIDDVQVWQRTLSAQEAHDLANAATPLTNYGLAEGCATELTSTTSSVPSLQSYWAFEDGAGATAADSSSFYNDATLNGGYTWTTGHTGGGVHFDGATGYARSGGSAVDSTRSFTVSAWAKPDDLNGYYPVFTEQGSSSVAFQLRYSKDVNRGVFGMTSADNINLNNYTWAVGKSAPQAGAWTLLTASFNSETMQIKLYVNGKLDAQNTVSTTWNAPNGFVIGAALGNSMYFKGSIDQVQAWSQALTDDQIAALAGLTYFDTINGTQGTATGGVSLGAEPDTYGHPTGCAAEFNNSATGQVDTGRPANFRTDRSYTVEAWVRHTRTAADVAANGTVDPYVRAAIGVADAQYSPLMLGYRPITGSDGKLHGRWSFMVPQSATSSSQWLANSDQDALDNTWVHLIGTYDAATGTITLYVNGVKQGTFTNTTSAGGGVTGWNGSGNVLIGRDVWNARAADQWYGGLAGARVYAGVRTSDGIYRDHLQDDPGLLFGITH